MKRTHEIGDGVLPPNIDAIIDEVTGAHEGSLFRARSYDGQPHTDGGERGKTEVTGITFRDLRDCFIRAVAQASGPGPLYRESEKGERANICENDLFDLDLNKIDIIAVQQCLTCEVEKLMGIYPNVPKSES